MAGSDDDLHQLKHRLGSLKTDPPASSELQLAAVLVPFVSRTDGWRLVLTRRTEGLRRHGGEIAFPGGRVDPGEEPRETALRETQEELGIPSEKVEILGPLPLVTTNVSRYVICPWVAIVPPAIFTPSPEEIAEVIEVPLERFSSPTVRRHQRFVRAGGIALSPAYDIGPNTIWGATARVIGHLLDLIE